MRRPRNGLLGWAMLGVLVASSCSTSKPTTASTPSPTVSRTTTAPTSPPSARATATPRPPLARSDLGRLSLVRKIGGPISPKSVVANGYGVVFAQNMMYRHTVTAYASNGDLVATIPDAVQLDRFGVSGHPGVSRGAPVETAFSPDGRYAYVSNYSMYGRGFGPEGKDSCTPSSSRAAGVSPSFVYRVNTATKRVDKVIQVGRVPKYVAVTPDGRHVLVTNWCSYSLDVIDVARWQLLREIPLGAYPRGIAVSPDSKTAYVAVMGSTHLSVVDLSRSTVTATITVGRSPRHVVVSPGGQFLYVSLNGGGGIVKVDVARRAVVGRVATGSQPRSVAIAADGRSLYVVNYASNTVSKVRAADLALLQTLRTGTHPIGVSYDRATGNVWVAIYTGQILVLRNT